MIVIKLHFLLFKSLNCIFYSLNPEFKPSESVQAQRPALYLYKWLHSISSFFSLTALAFNEMKNSLAFNEMKNRVADLYPACYEALFSIERF